MVFTEIYISKNDFFPNNLIIFGKNHWKGCFLWIKTLYLEGVWFFEQAQQQQQQLLQPGVIGHNMTNLTGVSQTLNLNPTRQDQHGGKF